jgi:DNA mismatch endonuclease (patch repair protein)
MDVFTPEKRSEVMSKVKGRDTRPERVVRSLLHRMGLRFRKNVSSLPGSPDVVLPGCGTAVFVHGCFWHRHRGCAAGARVPRSNIRFWSRKFARNVARDARTRRELEGMGWRVVVVWECELRDMESLAARLAGKQRKPKPP